ncbi:transcriptional regulator [Corynebacterium comes]|uniref:Helix-turn-helix domain protein n=1 Tax=Corynebacterium comes TaxID=2675218 RepID=A0A6B8VJV4_9CORY|nr:transcriptional regulator [Corynebacterium comes]QGU03339.1 Helix-turn-helix domain protein [Corynebacterium comes]
MTVEPLFDDLIHNPVRLRICGMLRRVDAVSFTTLQEVLGVSKPTLSKHLSALADAGYLTMDKLASDERSDRRRVAWAGMTRAGRTAFDGHIAALREITTP